MVASLRNIPGISQSSRTVCFSFDVFRHAKELLTPILLCSKYIIGLVNLLRFGKIFTSFGLENLTLTNFFSGTKSIKLS